MEQRVFYRLISGLHASTTAHISESFHHPDGSWGPNLDMFIYRLGSFPDRMKNIYFTFVYLLRAAHKASTFLSNYDYDTAHPQEDQKVQSHVRSLLSSSLVCSSTFDETTLFQGERASLKGDFMAKFRNISEIMDCVSCQTCKVHAKLQILGIATATKILITDDSKIIQGLQHNEISALINTLFKFSESIQIMHSMHEREDAYLKEKSEQAEKEESGHAHHHFSLYALIVAVVFLTVATLYWFSQPTPTNTNKTQTKPAGSSHKNGADESTGNQGSSNDEGAKTTLRKSSDKVKSTKKT